jgi:hypothetical protein
MRIRSVLVVAVALLLVGGTLSSLALAEPPRHAQVVHSVSGAAAYAPGSPWSGSFLFSAEVRADGTVSGRVVYEDGIVGDKADGIVTHVNVVGNRATVFAKLPEGYQCTLCGPGVYPTHFFFVVVQGTGCKPHQLGWPLYFAHWESPEGHVYTVEELMAMTPREFIAWEASWGFFDPPLLPIEGHVLVR